MQARASPGQGESKTFRSVVEITKKTILIMINFQAEQKVFRLPIGTRIDVRLSVSRKSDKRLKRALIVEISGL